MKGFRLALATLTLGLLGSWLATAAKAQSRSLPNPDETVQLLMPQDYVQQIRAVETTPVEQSQPAAQAPAPVADTIPGESEYDRSMRLGYTESRLGNYQTALQYFEAALKVNPGDRMATIAYWNMINALQVTQQAPAQVAARISNEPAVATVSDFDSYMNAGYAAVEIRDYEAALRYFDSALQLRPDNPYAQQAIRNMNTYLQAGQPQEVGQ